jgi:hypothetical protein
VIILNPIASNISKWWTFKLLRWIQNLDKSVWAHMILYADRSSNDEQLLVRPFFDKPKIRTWRAVETQN